MKFSLRTLLILALVLPPLLGYFLLRLMNNPPRRETYAAPTLDVVLGYIRDLLIVAAVAGLLGAWWFIRRRPRQRTPLSPSQVSPPE
jgi:hypothetical protein